MIVQGDALHLPLADESVDLVVTSPPYFALRSYRDGGEHYEGQIGSEPTPEAFLDALDKVMVELGRVLKGSGSVWINLGDKYAGSFGGGGASQSTGLDGGKRTLRAAGGGVNAVTDIRHKSLMGLPWRFAIRQIDAGWILRAEVIWSKPNGLPESVTDRVRRSHEQWFHLVKEPKYFSAVDEIREPYAPASLSRMKYGDPLATSSRQPARLADGGNTPYDGPSPLGRLPGSVWTIPTEPLSVPEQFVDHFAAFPQEWPRKIILGWSPSGICTVCGEGRRPVVEAPHRGDNNPDSRNGSRKRSTMDGGSKEWAERMENPPQMVGYSCDCPTPEAPTRPAVVLDPFGGTGTVAGVARKLGRTGISLDLSMDYSRLAKWRVYESGHFDKTLRRTMGDRQGALI